MNNHFFDIGHNSMFIILGQACNLQCKYCLKHTMVNQQLAAEPSEKLLDYLEYIIKTRNESFFITFYGGEPLLYFETIKRIKEYCDDKEKEFNKKILNYGIISNAKALTQKITDWVSENNISFTVSYDGYNSIQTRGFDPIKEKEELLLQIPGLNLSAVVTSANYPLDILNAFQEFNNKYFDKHNKHTGINLDELMDTGCGIETQDLLDINQDRYNEDIKAILDSYAEAIKAKKTELSIIEQWGEMLVNRMMGAKEDPNKALQLSKCKQTLNVLNVDLEGNIYSCHNSTEENLGTITDQTNSVVEKLISSEYNIMHRRRTLCDRCEAEYICQGGCKLISDERITTTCKLKKGVIPTIKDALIKILKVTK